jgi:hypothetical protein
MMSTYHQIFVHSAEPSGTLLADLTAICGAPFATIDDGQVDYASHTDTAFVDLELSHEFDADRDMPIDQYPWLITIRDRDRDQERQERVAREIFDALATTGRYRLMLTRDLQRLLAMHPARE